MYQTTIEEIKERFMSKEQYEDALKYVIEKYGRNPLPETCTYENITLEEYGTLSSIGSYYFALEKAKKYGMLIVSKCYDYDHTDPIITKHLGDLVYEYEITNGLREE